MNIGKKFLPSKKQIGKLAIKTKEKAKKVAIKTADVGYKGLAEIGLTDPNKNAKEIAKNLLDYKKQFKNIKNSIAYPFVTLKKIKQNGFKWAINKFIDRMLEP